MTKVDKPWGYELHWAKTDRYVGKVIHIDAGHALSLQYHNRKEETIYLHTGKLLYEIEVDGQLKRIEMKPGDAVLYRGVERRHGRVTPNPNRSSAHLFLHFVERGGKHEAHAFDAVRVQEVRQQQLQGAK